MIDVTRLLLAAVFVVAALGKLADREGSRQSVRDFGLSSRLDSALALLFPVAELTVAVALVPGGSARYAAAGALGLLTLFTLAIARALVRGRKPDCHCFGRFHSAPAGPGTLARNVALGALAVLIASQPASTPNLREVAATAVAIAILAETFLVRALLRRYGRALRRIEELEGLRTVAVGAEAPDFALPSAAGGEVTLVALLARARPVLLVFIDPGCGPCQALIPRLASWQERLESHLTVAVLSSGKVERNAAMTAEQGLRDLLLQEEREVAARYGVGATPSAVLVDADGRIAQNVRAGSRAIEELVLSLFPDGQPAREASNGRARAGTAAALAGGLAVAASAAPAAPDRSDRPRLDPELQAVDDALRAAGPRLAAASTRSRKAIRAQATLKTGKKVRAKRVAAKRALAAERREVLALRTKIDALRETPYGAHNVKVILHSSLTFLSQSLRKREQAVGASPKAALRLIEEAQALFLRSFDSAVAAARLLGRG